VTVISVLKKIVDKVSKLRYRRALESPSG